VSQTLLSEVEGGVSIIGFVKSHGDITRNSEFINEFPVGAVADPDTIRGSNTQDGDVGVVEENVIEAVGVVYCVVHVYNIVL